MRFVIPISTNKGQPITKIQSAKTNSLILSNEVNIKNEISIITRRETKMFILCVQIKQTFLVPFGDRSNAIVPQMGKINKIKKKSAFQLVYSRTETECALFARIVLASRCSLDKVPCMEPRWAVGQSKWRRSSHWLSLSSLILKAF